MTKRFRMMRYASSLIRQSLVSLERRSSKPGRRCNPAERMLVWTHPCSPAPTAVQSSLQTIAPACFFSTDRFSKLSGSINETFVGFTLNCWACFGSGKLESTHLAQSGHPVEVKAYTLGSGESFPSSPNLVLSHRHGNVHPLAIIYAQSHMTSDVNLV